MNISALIARIVSLVSRDPHLIAGMNARGIFRAFVEDVMDPEHRGRVRVRIPAFHGSKIPTGALPWAERCLPDASNNAGDVIPLRAGIVTPSGHTGDGVWVMCEGGDHGLPVVVGAWYAAPSGQSEAPLASEAATARLVRRRVFQTRHGTRIELGDDPHDQEVKISTPDGHILHMRESDGGRGIHVQTAAGHRISLQDEQAGESRSVPQNAYDAAPDEATGLEPPLEDAPPGVFAAERRTTFGERDRRSPDGTVRSGSSRVPSGYGSQGILIETTNGHRARFRDRDDPGIDLTTADGHRVTLNDDDAEIIVSTSDGNTSMTLTEGGGITLSCPGQPFVIEAATVDINQA